MTAPRLRILVLGYVVRGPLAGPTWHHLQYVLGLRALGHDVWYLEDSTDTAFCYDPSREAVGTDPRYGLDYITRVFARAGVGDRWAYHDAHDRAAGAPADAPGRWHGPAAAHALALCRSADVMLNVSGINPMRAWLRDIPHRVLIDTDPVFTQVDHLQDAPQRAFAQAHNAFFTFGECFGQPGCTMPDDGLPWKPTRQPVVLDAWRPEPGRADGAFSTVMLWDSYERRQWQGRVFGMKAEEMEHVLNLPRRCTQRFEVAVGSPTTPHDRLTDNGWMLRNPLELTCDPWVYQDYMRASKAEFSVAKHGYVTTGSGWFSERSCGYLACGRPVVTQETGFSAHLPTGAGLVPWSTPDEALAAVEEVAAHYDKHCSAAREIVATCFDARRVLQDLLERL